MKKVMIAAIAVAIGFAVQANDLKWGIANVYAGNDTTKADGYIAYLFTANEYSYESAVADISGKNVSFLSKAIGTVALNSSGTVSSYVKGSVAKPEEAYDLTGYIVIVDSATTPTTAYMTSALDSNVGTAGGAVNFAFGTASTTTSTKAPDSRNSANWYAVGSTPVPEPTSGLLLLVGGALLGLRRRRA